MIKLSKNKFLIIIVILQLSLAVFSSLKKTWTIDEQNHLRYGREIIEERTFDRFDNSKMTVSAINALSRKIYLLIDKTPDPTMIRLAARFPTMLMGTGITILMYLWVSLLFNKKTACISSLIVALEPNLLAHSRWVTTDIPVTFFTFATGFLLYLWFTRAQFKYFLSAGVTTGCAVSSKFSAIAFLPFVFIVIVYFIVHRINRTEVKKTKKSIESPLLNIIVICLIIYLTICITNGFFHLGRPIGLVKWHTKWAKNFANAHPRFPLVLPENFIQGLDWIVFDDNRPVEVYFCGKIFTDPVLEYFPVTFLLKTPLGILSMLFLSFFSSIRSAFNKNFLLFKKISWGFIPGIYFFLIITLFLRSQLGVRFLLPCYPFFILVVSGFIFTSTTSLIRFVMLLFVGWQILSTLSFYPHFLPYCNELIGSRLNLYKYLADSNNDWGQDWLYLSQAKKNYIGSPFSIKPSHPECGIICIRINDLVGILSPTEKYRWLREKYQPFHHIGYSFLLYKISPDDMLKYKKLQEINPLRLSLIGQYADGLTEELFQPIEKGQLVTRNIIGELPIITRDKKTFVTSPVYFTWTAFWKVEENGVYLIGTESDDGSYIEINSKIVVDNRGVHDNKFVSQVVLMKRGYYRIRVYYDDRGGDKYFKFHCFQLKPKVKKIYPKFFVERE